MSGKPRLGYLFSRYPVLSHTFCDNEILGLRDAGWDVLVLSSAPPPNSMRHDRLTCAGVPVVYGPPIPVAKRMEADARRQGTWPAEMLERHDSVTAGNATSACRQALYWVSEAQALGIQHVHVHFTSRAAHTALLLKKMSGLTYSVTPQASDFFANPKVEGILPELLAEAEFVVCPCDYVRRRLKESFPDVEARYVTIYNGVAPENYPRAEPAEVPRPLRVACVARLVEFKGFRHLFGAIAIAKDAGVQVELTIIGDGPLKEDLERRVLDLGIVDSVQFKGSAPVEAMKELFTRSDLFALACVVDSEGGSDVLPTVITEAMLSSLPVLSSRVAGVPEQVSDGETGILTEPGDERALADGLIRFAQEPGLARKMGMQGRTRAQALLSLHSTIPQLISRFEGLAPSPVLPVQPTRFRLFDLRETDDVKSLVAWSAQRSSDERAIVAGAGALDDSEINKIDLPWSDFWFIPEGMVLEMEWLSRPDAREALVAMRSDLSTEISGELFFVHARRALWITVFARSIAADFSLTATSSMEPTARLVHQLQKYNGSRF